MKLYDELIFHVKFIIEAKVTSSLRVGASSCIEWILFKKEYLKSPKSLPFAERKPLEKKIKKGQYFLKYYNFSG